jgi:hypothetical protein
MFMNPLPNTGLLHQIRQDTIQPSQTVYHLQTIRRRIVVEEPEVGDVAVTSRSLKSTCASAK